MKSTQAPGIALAALFSVLIGISSASGENLESCDFEKWKSSCSAPFSFDEATNTYRVGAAGACRVVTVKIDETSSPHHMKDDDVVQSVTVFDKNRTVKASLVECSEFNSKKETLATCKNVYLSEEGRCDALATKAASYITGTLAPSFKEAHKGQAMTEEMRAKWRSVWKPVYGDALQCYARVPDAVFRCTGFTATKPATGTGVMGNDFLD